MNNNTGSIMIKFPTVGDVIRELSKFPTNKPFRIISWIGDDPINPTELDNACIHVVTDVHDLLVIGRSDEDNAVSLEIVREVWADEDPLDMYDIEPN